MLRSVIVFLRLKQIIKCITKLQPFSRVVYAENSYAALLIENKLHVFKLATKEISNH